MPVSTMKLLRTFCFFAIILGSTAALPAHKEKLANVRKSSVSEGTIILKNILL